MAEMEVSPLEEMANPQGMNIFAVEKHGLPEDFMSFRALYGVCVCVCFLPIHSGHQVRWTYQPGSHRRKVTQDFSSTFFLRCVP